MLEKLKLEMAFLSANILLLIILPYLLQSCQSDRDDTFRNSLMMDEKSWSTLNYQPVDRKFVKAYLQYRSDLHKSEAKVDLNCKRLAAFTRNLESIEAHNARYNQGSESFRMGINHLTDWPYEDYKRRNSLRPSQQLQQHSRQRRSTTEVHLVAPDTGIPEVVDWRKFGLVTPVQNQGTCGSCWTFAVVGALEGQHRRATGNLVSLSEQNLLDCVSSTLHTNDGCRSGIIQDAYKYIIYNGGIESSYLYPYVGYQQECRFWPGNVAATQAWYHTLQSGDEKQLAIAVATVGPIVVGIDASDPSFQNYESGIYRRKNCTAEGIDHAVLVIGYGSEPVKQENGTIVMQNYWLIKNSWGAWWGEDGYFRLAKDDGNMCGVATMASFPMVRGIDYQGERIN